MTPWPADVQASFNLSPTTSPMQQSDPFTQHASFGATPGMPQLSSQAPAPGQKQQQQQQQQQQPPQQQPPQQGRDVDPSPWATMLTTTAQAQGAAPAQAPGFGAPNSAPTPAPTNIVSPGVPAGAPSTDYSAPPPAVVVADSGNKTPPSPIGDMSVIAAAGLGNSNADAAATNAPSMPNGMQMNGMQAGGAQQLQPNAQQMQLTQGAFAQAPQAAPQPTSVSNSFDFRPVAAAMPQPQAPPPANSPPRAPPSPTDQQQQQPGLQMITAPVSPVLTNGFAPQSTNYADPFGYAFTPMTSPVTSPITSPNTSPGGGNNGALVQSSVPNADPFGVHGGAPPGAQAPPAGMLPSVPNSGAPQFTQAPADAQAMVPSAAPSADPFGVFGSQAAPAPADPFGSSALVPSGPAAGGAVDDPFGIFGSPTPVAAAEPTPAPAQAPPPAQPQSAPQEEDPWAAAGFGQTTSSPQMDHVASTSSPRTSDGETKVEDSGPVTLDSNGLPNDGEYYEARINARSLGAMFYTSLNLQETLYHKMPRGVVSALGTRPVVAYVAEGSAAHNSGIHLGHVILSVNGHETKDPEFCAQMIRNAPRPMNLRCWVPPAMELTLNEGRHLVKYDTKDLEAPGSSVEWKRKYVVVGGIVTKPWMMNMFYRKKDYDIAVKEAHAGHKISVKVKQFDLRGARIILKGRDGKPNWVDYPSERRPWYYITVVPNKGYPIKISSESLDDLEPVYASIRRFVRKDMEARYQYRVDEGFGYNGMSGSKKGSSHNGGFQQFDDAQRKEHWR